MMCRPGATHVKQCRSSIKQSGLNKIKFNSYLLENFFDKNKNMSYNWSTKASCVTNCQGFKLAIQPDKSVAHSIYR
jgi:hypothetical protein